MFESVSCFANQSGFDQPGDFMDSDFTIYFVDDAIVERRMIEVAFGRLYNVVSFASPSECLTRVHEQVPDMFLLDVDMPEMDGYELCKRIRECPTCEDLPVVFLSARDDLDSRLAGYDAGGNDYIVKPFQLAELKQKLELSRQMAEEKRSLKSQLNESDKLASLVLSNLDEYAVLVSFLRSLNSCEIYPDITDALLDMLDAYRLDGAVQIRLPLVHLTRDRNGRSSPLIASIISHVKSMGSIAEFKSRVVFNYERVSLLVTNMPVDDAELRGRLRDHLAIAVETTMAKVSSMLSKQENAETRDEIAALSKLVAEKTGEFNEKYRQAHVEATKIVQALIEEMDEEFVNLGLREFQEESLSALIQHRAEKLLATLNFRADTEKALGELTTQLEQIIYRGVVS